MGGRRARKGGLLGRSINDSCKSAWNSKPTLTCGAMAGGLGAIPGWSGPSLQAAERFKGCAQSKQAPPPPPSDHTPLGEGCRTPPCPGLHSCKSEAHRVPDPLRWPRLVPPAGRGRGLPDARQVSGANSRAAPGSPPPRGSSGFGFGFGHFGPTQDPVVPAAGSGQGTEGAAPERPLPGASGPDNGRSDRKCACAQGGSPAAPGSWRPRGLHFPEGPARRARTG